MPLPDMSKIVYQKQYLMKDNPILKKYIFFKLLMQ